MKKKQFIVSELDLATNKQPLDSWAVARLFYGVPRWANSVREDITSGDLIFTKE